VCIYICYIYIYIVCIITHEKPRTRRGDQREAAQLSAKLQATVQGTHSEKCPLRLCTAKKKTCLHAKNAGVKLAQQKNVISANKNVFLRKNRVST